MKQTGHKITMVLLVVVISIKALLNSIEKEIV